ncbi:ATP-dependent DNA helicase PIF1 [Eumeta japonica]|uniref:ATP-dependent DNA helicase PIF1 n=1 Tax=Eumeta variegata TaxID=151549 RepID=A0A4C1VZ33_EUMVA|nr:ATP-dependent DNA helicase PIF1 [Eumeta japonica]
MVTVNIDTTDGLVNGTTGILKAIDYGRHKKTSEKRPLRIWVLFDKSTGIATRSKCQVTSKTSSISQFELDAIRCRHLYCERWKSSNLVVQRTQFPIVPAEGITIHKSQGATLEKVVVHISKNVKRSMLYVACSRAMSSFGLFLVVNSGTFKPPSEISESSAVSIEMKRLEQNKLVPYFKFLQTPEDNAVQIVFHNVQSLRKHFSDVIIDPIIHSSHAALFVETWGCRRDTFELDGFYEVCRVDGPAVSNANPGWGSIAYVCTEPSVRESDSHLAGF